VVCVSQVDPSIVSGVTYNGDALTKVIDRNDADYANCSIWRIVAPDTGTHDIVVSHSNSSTVKVYGVAFTGVDQSSPTGATTGDTGTGTTASKAITTTKNGSVIISTLSRAGASDGSNGPTAGTGQTNIADNLFGNSHWGAGTYESKTTVGADTQSWTWTGSQIWSMVSIEIKKSADNALQTNLESDWKLDGNSTDEIANNNGADTAINYETSLVTDNFDSYTDGDLNGQGGWSGSALFDIQTAVKNSGAKALKVITAGSLVGVTKTGIKINDGKQTFYLRAEQTNASGEFVLLSPTDDLAISLSFYTDGHIHDYSGSGGATDTDLGAYSTSQFYKVDVEWRSSDHKHRITIDNGTPSDWLDVVNDNPDNATKVRIQARDTGTFYYDDLSGATTSGKINQGARFDGTTSKIVIADATGLKPTIFTLSAWIKTATKAALQNIFQSWSGNATYAGLYIFMSTNGYVYTYIAKNTGKTYPDDFEQLNNGVDMSDGNWHMITVTYDGSDIKMYTDNGTPVTTAWSSGLAYAATNYVRIGCNNDSGTDQVFMNGTIDEVGFWSRALSATEVGQLYNGGSGLAWPLTVSNNSNMFLFF